ncbi:hypothetical protein [Pseudodesulfovibrio piezophilus]|nr:hypothetical protein [Pseudodesulfovibrio piezophilus]
MGFHKADPGPESYAHRVVSDVVCAVHASKAVEGVGVRGSRFYLVQG